MNSFNHAALINKNPNIINEQNIEQANLEWTSHLKQINSNIDNCEDGDILIEKVALLAIDQIRNMALRISDCT